MIPGPVRTGGQFTRSTGQIPIKINEKMKNLIGSVNRSPLRCGFFTLAIALCWFALSPPLKAVDCPSDCDNSIGQTALGFTALAVNTGFNNTGVGQGALQNNTTGGFNVAIGGGALLSNTTGQQNMAVGAEALNHNITGNFNMGIGFRALFMNTGGQNTAVGAAALRNNGNASENTAIGSTAMRENSTGENNTAIGSGALTSLNGGDRNTAVGRGAGANYTGAETNNICIGAQTGGVTGESNAIRIGTNSTSGGINVVNNGPAANSISIGAGNASNGITVLETLFGSTISIGSALTAPNAQTFVGGIFNAVPAIGSHLVVVGANGKLADSFVSSRRFKKDIAPIDKISEGILALKPVTFHFKNDDTNYPQFGLIAEDVAEVNPDWITRDPQGEIHGVRYDTIPVLLLNEFLKEHKKVEEQQASIAELKSTVALQQKEMQVLTAQLKEQAAQIQKVSAQLEASKPAPKVVANK
jgi:hypothetical protein